MIGAHAVLLAAAGLKQKHALILPLHAAGLAVLAVLRNRVTPKPAAPERAVHAVLAVVPGCPAHPLAAVKSPVLIIKIQDGAVMDTLIRDSPVTGAISCAVMDMVAIQTRNAQATIVLAALARLPALVA